MFFKIIKKYLNNIENLYVEQEKSLKNFTFENGGSMYLADTLDILSRTFLIYAIYTLLI